MSILTANKLPASRPSGAARRCTVRCTAAAFICFLMFLASFALDHLLPGQLGAQPAWAVDKKEEGGGEKKVRKKRKRKESKEDGKDGETAKLTESELQHGAGIDGFGRKDFEAMQKAAAIDAILLLDASRSMQRTDPQRLRDQGAKLFIRFLGEGDRIAIVQFDREAAIVEPLTLVTPEFLAELDKKIESVNDEGNFTDLRAPVVKALEMLSVEGRPDAQKCVVLLSDGKMDPHPSSGAREELVGKLQEVDFPQYRERGIKLYSLSLSPEADRQLLGEMAGLGNGLHRYAPSADEVHKAFSDLFLSLKKPQVVALEGAQFEIDGSVNEATFFITRKKADQMVTIVDPQGKSFNNETFPTGVKWFRGDLFDVITVKGPLPGPWSVRDIEQPEGYATLLTDLELQARPLPNNLNLGDTAALMVQLTDKEKQVRAPEIAGVIFFTYKIFDSTSGTLVTQGSLLDRGEDGDEKAGDGIYSHLVKIDKEGEYKALLSATGPTFNRQQIVPFNVSSGLVSLREQPPNEFLGDPGGLRVFLSKRALEVKKPELQLVAKREGQEGALAIKLDKYRLSENSFRVPLEILEAGEYELTARLHGLEENKRKMLGASETVRHTVGAKKQSEGAGEGEDEVHVIEDEPQAAEHEEEQSLSSPLLKDLKWGLLSWIISLAWSGSLGWWVYRSTGKSGGVTVTARPVYVAPEELLKQIEEQKARASKTLRVPTEEEREFFKEIGEIFTELAAELKPIGVDGHADAAPALRPAPDTDQEADDAEAPEEDDAFEQEENQV